MSNQVFPTFTGLSWGVNKIPTWSTEVQKALSGNESRVSYMSYPIYRFNLSYEVLRASVAHAELQSLMGFFNARRGAFENFLFTDPTDSTVTDQVIGAGTGSQTQFQIVRTMGGFTEPVMNLNGNPVIKVNGVTQTLGGNYTVNSTGMVTFASPPTAGASITFTGSYYFRVRFTKDELDFENFMFQLWQLKKCELTGSLGVKV